MEIFKTFGLDPYLLITQIVNFLIIFYLLKRFLYKPLTNAIKKRQELAKESIDNAKNSEKLLEKAKEDEQEIIKKAKATAAEVIKDAREQASDIVKKSQADTKEQTDKMLKDAKEQIAIETEEAQKQLDKYVVKLSLELLKKSLGNVFTEKEQNEIIARATKEIQKRPN